MSEIYLREVQLKDFRTFGDFSLALPPGPGLTLLVGTNGLGKSNFFDGIEWCLTGTVRRFEQYVGRLEEAAYLTRRDAPAAAHQAYLQFTTGETLTRNARGGASEEAVASLLKQPEWTDIKNPAAYLAFTHFLGQASQLRFTSREQSEQWEALKGPSGIDRLEAIRTALRGRATMTAFRRRAEKETVVLQGAEQALSQWRERAERLAELRSRGAAAGAEPQSAIEARLAALEQVAPGEPQAMLLLSNRLSAARGRITEAARRVTRDQSALDLIRPLVERHAAAVAESDPSGERVESARAAVEAATAVLTNASLTSTESERALRVQAELIAHTEAELDRLSRIRVAIAQHGLLETERQQLIDSERTLGDELEVQEKALADAKAALTRAFETQQALTALEMEHGALLRWSDRIAALGVQEVDVRARRNTAANAAATAQDAQAKLAELQRNAEDASGAVEEGARRLAALQRDASTLAELLSELAGHIGHDDEACPVCTTRFPPGRLQELARASVGAQDVRLADEVHAADALRNRHTVAKQALERAQALIAAAASVEAEALSAASATAAERAAIEETLGVSPGSDLARHIADRLAAVADARAARVADSGGSPAEIASVQERVDSLDAAVNSLRERIVTAAQRRTRSESSLNELTRTLAADPTSWSLEAADAAVETQISLLRQARERRTDLQAAFASAASDEEAARQRLTAAEVERERVLGAIESARRAVTDALAAWRAAEMDDVPSRDAIERREDALSRRAAELAGQLDEEQALARAYEVLLAQEQLGTLTAAMEAEGGAGAADDPTVHEQRLQARLNSSRAALRLIEDTRKAVVAYTAQLKTQAEDFSSKFLLPLNDLIDAFNRALLSTPGETVQFNAAHTVERTSLGMRLRYADPIENARYRTELPPQLVLSEGQMAANGFSILCAASTAYRWSRWPALLLDDPLQHNDIIHAAAFVDVMRNLVEIEGYQLVMSSHKRDEGEFIARKFDAAGLPCTVLALTAASKDGVKFDPPRHNAAARRLLVSSEAKLA